MLSIKNLTKIYHSEQEGSLALNNISIDFPEIGFVAITGESGSGKTTLLNVLSGFLPYEEGDYYVDGVNFLTFTDEDLELFRKNAIGFVFQDYHLVEHHKVIDNLIESLLIVGVPYKEAKKEALEYLKRIDLLEYKNNKASQLSSGQKQKLSIARAIIKKPKIVFCDEPTANLDVETSLEILKLLKEYAKDHLVVVSTHSYEIVKDYATHFMRLYKGNLTSFNVVKEENNEVPQQKENRSTNPFHLFLITSKNAYLKMISKVSFFAVFVTIFLFLLTLFSANIDISSTKVLSRSVFNNISQTEVLLMKKDRSLINEEELLSLNNSSHITGVQLYGLATEMNYYYRKDIDYEFKATIVPGKSPFDEPHTEYVFQTISDDLFVKSYVGLTDASNLASGNLPTSFLEVAANSNYEIGQQITVYFHEPVLLGKVYIKLTFTVSGILKNASDDLYFSPEFIKHMDYLQYHSDNREFRFGINCRLKTFGNSYTTKNEYFILNPIYNPALGKKEVQVSSAFLLLEADRIPADQDINYYYAYLEGGFDDRITVTYPAEKAVDDLPSNYIYVGEDIYHMYIDKYDSSTARVYIDNYSYIDDVISNLTKKNYDCLSPYRAGSTQFDPEKQNFRAMILIVSVVLVFIFSLVYFLFGYLFEKSKLSEDKTFSLLGCSNSTLNKMSLLNLLLTTLLGIILGFIIYAIIANLPIAFIIDMNLYLRFYHFIIVAVLSLLLGALIWGRYVAILRKKIRKGNTF